MNSLLPSSNSSSDSAFQKSPPSCLHSPTSPTSLLCTPATTKKPSRFTVTRVPPASTPNSRVAVQPQSTPQTQATPMQTQLTTSPKVALSTSSATRAHQPGQQIHNKIEQALDLVKSHLTLAVRQEVENMRNIISHLEVKVASLEAENKMLRQHADVLQQILRRY